MKDTDSQTDTNFYSSERRIKIYIILEKKLLYLFRGKCVHLHYNDLNKKVESMVRKYREGRVHFRKALRRETLRNYLPHVQNVVIK